MKMKIELTANEMMNVVDAVMDEAIDRGYDPVEDVDQFNDLIAIVDAALSAMGIEYDVTDEDFEDEEDEMESIIYDVDGHRGISASDARLLMACVVKTIKEHNPILSDEVIKIMMQIECLRIAHDYGIEVVDTTGE